MIRLAFVRHTAIVCPMGPINLITLRHIVNFVNLREHSRHLPRPVLSELLQFAEC